VPQHFQSESSKYRAGKITRKTQQPPTKTKRRPEEKKKKKKASQSLLRISQPISLACPHLAKILGHPIPSECRKQQFMFKSGRRKSKTPRKPGLIIEKSRFPLIHLKFDSCGRSNSYIRRKSRSVDSIIVQVTQRKLYSSSSSSEYGQSM